MLHIYIYDISRLRVKKIRDRTGARIVFPTDKDENKEVITITGKQKAAELEATIKGIDNICENDMRVKPRHQHHFVA